MTFEEAIADYILHKGWLVKAKEDVETSKATFIDSGIVNIFPYSCMSTNMQNKR